MAATSRDMPGQRPLDQIEQDLASVSRDLEDFLRTQNMEREAELQRGRHHLHHQQRAAPYPRQRPGPSRSARRNQQQQQQHPQPPLAARLAGPSALPYHRGSQQQQLSPLNPGYGPQQTQHHRLPALPGGHNDCYHNQQQQGAIPGPSSSNQCSYSHYRGHQQKQQPHVAPPPTSDPHYDLAERLQAIAYSQHDSYSHRQAQAPQQQHQQRSRRRRHSRANETRKERRLRKERSERRKMLEAMAIADAANAAAMMGGGGGGGGSGRGRGGRGGGREYDWYGDSNAFGFSDRRWPDTPPRPNNA